jgi:hypothetical protein
MATFASWQELNRKLKFKALTGAALWAPATATFPSTISGSDSSLITKPTGYKDLGYLSEDGVSAARSADKTDIGAWQSVTPIRSDVTSDTEQLTLTMEEINAYSLALYNGVDLSALVPDATSGEVKFDKPPVPVQPEFRMLVLARDTTDYGDIYFCFGYPSCKVSDWDDLQIGKTDAGLELGVTIDTYVDNTVGTAKRTWVAGPGVKSLATAMRLPTGS